VLSVLLRYTDSDCPYIEEEQTTQWQKEKVQTDKQRSIKHTFKTKDLVTRTPLKTGVELRCSGRVRSSCSTSGTRRVNLVTNKLFLCQCVVFKGSVICQCVVFKGSVIYQCVVFKGSVICQCVVFKGSVISSKYILLITEQVKKHGTDLCQNR
jgi:ADP-glucose pyrophosphorylase